MKSIRKYLKEVRNSLREYEESLTEREKEEFVEYCRNAIRDGEGDYSDKHYLELYILRYALAYGLQFSRMYAAILRDMGKPENIRVSSFGCGTGIDYWGLTYAAELLNEIDCDVDYRGYDPSEWSHRIMEEGRQRKNDTILYNKLDISGNIYEGIDTFDAYLEGIQTAKEQGVKFPGLNDVYIFPHSIMEVCVRSVPDEALQEGENYNTYQSMARFAKFLDDNLEAERPVYVAFSYRQKPSVSDDLICSLEEQGDYVPAYDMRYGTYLVSCLRSRGLKVTLLDPAKETLEHNRVSFETIGKNGENAEYSRAFFDYPDCHEYTGVNEFLDDGETEPKLDDFGYDGKYTFKSIFYAQDEQWRIASIEEWNEIYQGIYPLTKVNKMCFQVFKITKNPDVPHAGNDSVLNLYQQKINQEAGRVEEALRDYVIPEQGVWNMAEFLQSLKQYIGEEEKVSKKLTGINMRSWLVKEHYCERRSDNNRDYMVVLDYGKRTGMIMEELEDLQGETKIEILLKAVFCETLIGNIISGKYLNQSLFYEGVLEKEQIDCFPYQQEMLVSEKKDAQVQHIVDVLNDRYGFPKTFLTKAALFRFIVDLGYVQYDATRRRYVVTASGKRAGFSDGTEHGRVAGLIFANEVAQRMILSWFEPRNRY